MKRASRPSLETLRVFEASARLGGFTKAAQELGLSQSAVSLRMRDLQADLGVPVFARTRPTIVLTPAGERLAKQLSKALRLVADAMSEISASHAPLRLTVNPTFASRWLTPRLHNFRALQGAPRIMLDVTTDIRSIPGEADVAIRSSAHPWPGLSCTPLAPIERTPMMSPDLAAQLGDPPDPTGLFKLPLLHSDSWPRWFEAAGINAAEARDVGEIYPTQDLLARAAAGGAGVGLLSPALFADLVEQGELVAPFPIVLSGPDMQFAVFDPETSHPASKMLVSWLVDSLLQPIALPNESDSLAGTRA
jgi:LysR family glycine cleavage system transcriptional activator